MDHGSASGCLFISSIVCTPYRQRGCSVDAASAKPWNTLSAALGLGASIILEPLGCRVRRQASKTAATQTPSALCCSTTPGSHHLHPMAVCRMRITVGRNDSLCYLRVFLPACPLNSLLNRCARIGSRVALRGQCLTGRATARLKTGSKPSDAGVLGRVQAPDAQMSG